jgi:hypothetical protein
VEAQVGIIIAIILLAIGWRVWVGTDHMRQCAEELRGLSERIGEVAETLDKLNDFDLRAVAKAYEARMTAEDRRYVEEAKRAKMERRTAEKIQRMAEGQKRIKERSRRKPTIP